MEAAAAERRWRRCSALALALAAAAAAAAAADDDDDDFAPRAGRWRCVRDDRGSLRLCRPEDAAEPWASVVRSTAAVRGPRR